MQILAIRIFILTVYFLELLVNCTCIFLEYARIMGR